MSTIDQAHIRESPPVKVRRPNHWATPPTTCCAILSRYICLRDPSCNGNRTIKAEISKNCAVTLPRSTASEYVAHMPIFSCMLATVCCSVVGLWLGIVLLFYILQTVVVCDSKCPFDVNGIVQQRQCFHRRTCHLIQRSKTRSKLNLQWQRFTRVIWTAVLTTRWIT